MKKCQNFIGIWFCTCKYLLLAKFVYSSIARSIKLKVTSPVLLDNFSWKTHVKSHELINFTDTFCKKHFKYLTVHVNMFTRVANLCCQSRFIYTIQESSQGQRYFQNKVDVSGCMVSSSLKQCCVLSFTCWYFLSIYVETYKNLITVIE